MKYRALPFMPLDSVNDLVGWRDLGGNQLVVLLLEGHGRFHTRCPSRQPFSSMASAHRRSSLHA